VSTALPQSVLNLLVEKKQKRLIRAANKNLFKIKVINIFSALKTSMTAGRSNQIVACEDGLTICNSGRAHHYCENVIKLAE